MKPLKIISVLFFLSLFLACTKDKSPAPTAPIYSFEMNGIVAKQGITSYQYGTHTLSAGGQMFALKSSVVNLNKYINQSVTVRGNKVSGYPVDGGPEYIDVVEVK